MDSNYQKKIIFRKSFGQRFCLFAYIFIVISTIPSLTTEVMFNGTSSSAGGRSLMLLASFVFTVPIIRNLVMQNCIKSYFKSSFREPKLIRLLMASFKPSLVHIPLFLLPPFISLIISGGNFGYAGVGAIGTFFTFCAYLFAIDIPFRTRNKILAELKI